MPTTTDSQPAEVLVVEDESMLRRSIVRLLKKCGYSVTACGDGVSALEAVESKVFHAVLSDVNMPEMRGTELLRRIRAHAPDLPVIFITGEPNLESAIQAVSLGAFKYLTKPFENAELLQSLERAVQLGRISALRRLADSASTFDHPSVALENRFALAEAQLWVTFQPLVRRGAEEVACGYEALIRTGNPVLRNPEHLFQAASRLGRRDALNRFVQDTAVATMAGAEEHQILFLNVHPESLLDDHLLDESRPLVGMANRVVLEVTERTSVDGIPDLRKRVDRLRERGYRIAIDDIGAGYAGLSSFVALQPEFVKLDISLVRDVDSAPLKEALVKSMIEVSHDLGVEVAAEGIESAAEFEALSALSCDLFQGYYIAKPGRGLPTVGART